MKANKLQRAVDRMRAGSILARMHTRTGTCWYLVPDGEVPEDIAKALLERPDVQPNSNGLFPGIPQTFRMLPQGSGVADPLAHGLVAHHDTGAARRMTMDMRQYLTGAFVTPDDLRDGPHHETIVAVVEGKYDKPNIKFASGDLLSVNATNGRALMRAYGPETDGWIGKEIELYVGELEYQGKLQAGVRVRPISPTTPAETAAAGKRDDMNDEISY